MHPLHRIYSTLQILNKNRIHTGESEDLKEIEITAYKGQDRRKLKERNMKNRQRAFIIEILYHDSRKVYASHQCKTYATKRKKLDTAPVFILIIQ